MPLSAFSSGTSWFKQLFDLSPDPTWIIDGNQFVECNEAAIRTLGYTSREEFLNVHPSRLSPPRQADGEESFAKAERMMAIAKDKGLHRFEWMHTKADGSDFVAEVTLSTIELKGRSVIYCVWRDITERKRCEADLLAAKSAAEKANLDKSRFLAAASHDLRQPLSALSLYFDVLKKKVPPDSNELVSHIQVCVDSLNGLLTDLLDMSKLEAGAVKVKLTDVDLDDLVAKLVSVLSAEARQQGLRLRLRTRCAGMVVHTDPQLFKRILGNLIVNAIRYTHQGGVLIACRRYKGKQWIEIWDTGIGIPENQTGIIFEEFRQLGDAARNRGSGLGLSIVARTAALLGLEIRLSSRPGRGSMFAVELPVVQANIAATSPPVTLPQTRFLRIGLVEDHLDVLKALALVLKSLGHEVVAATNGRLLIERLGDRAPDIVISDYRLAEGETGFGVITAARDIFGEALPAFLITGDTDPTVVRRMAERGIEVLFKPLQIAALQAAIGKATARRRS